MNRGWCAVNPFGTCSAPVGRSGYHRRAMMARPSRLRVEVSSAGGAELGDEQIDAIGVVVRS